MEITKTIKLNENEEDIIQAIIEYLEKRGNRNIKYDKNCYINFYSNDLPNELIEFDIISIINTEIKLGR